MKDKVPEKKILTPSSSQVKSPGIDVEGMELSPHENTPVKLDEIDIAILNALSKNARAQLHELAAESKVSIPTARARLLRLQKLFVIRKFAAQLDFRRILGKGLFALVSAKIRIGLVNNIVRSIVNQEEVLEAFLTTGEQNLVLKLFLPDMESFNNFLKEKLAKIEGIETLNSNLVMEILKEEPNPSISLIPVSIPTKKAISRLDSYRESEALLKSSQQHSDVG
jgi:Lrp/AsnC family leucine-responsive transcriptional regulator